MGVGVIMKKEKQRDFVRRISQANKTELVAITFELIQENVNVAQEALSRDDIPGFRMELKMAQRFLGELIRSLDFKYPIAGDLFRLYQYVQNILVGSDVSGTDKGLDSVRSVTEKLGSAFSEIAAQDTSGSVMENAQQIYAGLTYGKGTLNESDMGAGTNRGFLA